MRELIILKQVRHPNIVEYFGAFDKDGDDEDSDAKDVSDPEVGLVMEVGQGTVEDLVEAKKGLDVEEVKHLSRQMMNGVAYLHAEKVIHR